MMLQIFCVFPASAEVRNNLYEYNGYNVEYTVTNEWYGGQTVEIKIINTGTESILNWAVKCEIDGEISNLWNAQIYDNKNSTYIFKNCGWNYEIRPNEYVIFGYTLNNDVFSIPEEIESCTERKMLTLGYSVDLNITSTWDTGIQGEIVIKNTSTEPLEAWILSFDSTFSIDNLWNARVLASENNHYSIASESWTNPIAVGESKAIGFVARKTTESQAKIENDSLSIVSINNNSDESDSSEEVEFFDKLIISAYGKYTAETNTIDVFWISTIPNGIFEILTSENNLEYTVIGNITDTDNYSVPTNSVQKYIKIKQTANDQAEESEAFAVIKTADGYTIDYIDTDNDGLYDYIEEAVGSEKSLSDTDSDGLTDYEELFLTNTDPVVYNSVDKDLSDAEADCDNDGLSNIEEINLGTSPLNEDYDGDGLIDGDEINKYGTDPLKFDTDNDGICDSDEIVLGLDPNNSKTNGVLDCERTTLQILDSSNNILSSINTEENPYSVSLELCVSGLADTNLEVCESGYSEIVQNDAILGSVLELDYPDNLMVEEVVINFEIKNEHINNRKSMSYDEFKGIKRLNVFRYFEEINMLLPIESHHDTKANIVYAKTDILGTYCLIDMEAWLDNIGIISEYSSNTPTALLSDNYADVNKEYTAIEYQANSANTTNSYVNSDSSNIQEETFAIVLEPVNELNDEIRDDFFHNAIYKYASDIHEKYEKYKIYFFDPYGNILTSPYGLNYATSLYDVHCICTNYSYSDIYTDYDHSIRDFYAYVATGGSFDKTDFAKFLSGMHLQNKNLADILLLPSTQLKDFMTFSNESQHFHIKFAFGLQYEHGYVAKAPRILTATGLTFLPEDFGRISSDNNLDYDNDGLANNFEIDWDSPLISSGKLPLLATCIHTANSSGKLTYVENGLERLSRLPNNAYYELLKTEILPLNSNPLDEDSDGDSLLDGKVQENSEGKTIAPKDPNPLKYDGPKGMWREHIKTAQSSAVATEIDDWYYNLAEKNVTENIGFEGFEVYKANVEKWAEKSGNPFSAYFIKHWGNVMYDSIQKLDVASFSIASGFFIAEIEKSFPNERTREIIYASLGSQALNFKMDNKCWSLHSQYNTWQSIGGYNNFYDFVFKTANNDNMEQLKLDFSLNMSPMEFFDKYGITETMGILDAFDFLSPTTDFIIWAWRGDYLNIGAGTEVGIYMRPHYWDYDTNGLDQYLTIKQLAVPMTLYLYNYDFSSQTVESNLVAWEPTTPQWWITGFNPNTVGQADVKKQVTIGSVDLSRFGDINDDNSIFYALMNKYSSSKFKDESKYLIFDAEKSTMWICWYEGA